MRRLQEVIQEIAALRVQRSNFQKRRTEIADELRPLRNVPGSESRIDGLEREDNLLRSHVDQIDPLVITLRNEAARLSTQGTERHLQNLLERRDTVSAEARQHSTVSNVPRYEALIEERMNLDFQINEFERLAATADLAASTSQRTDHGAMAATGDTEQGMRAFLSQYMRAENQVPAPSTSAPRDPVIMEARELQQEIEAIQTSQTDKTKGAVKSMLEERAAKGKGKAKEDEGDDPSGPSTSTGIRYTRN